MKLWNWRLLLFSGSNDPSWSFSFSNEAFAAVWSSLNYFFLPSQIVHMLSATDKICIAYTLSTEPRLNRSELSFKSLWSYKMGWQLNHNKFWPQCKMKDHRKKVITIKKINILMSVDFIHILGGLEMTLNIITVTFCAFQYTPLQSLGLFKTNCTVAHTERSLVWLVGRNTSIMHFGIV